MHFTFPQLSSLSFTLYTHTHTNTQLNNSNANANAKKEKLTYARVFEYSKLICYLHSINRQRFVYGFATTFIGIIDGEVF